MLTLLLLGCGIVAVGPRDLSPFQGGEISLIGDGVRLDARRGCPTIGPKVTGTVNGKPLTIHEAGGMRWGTSQDGLMPARVCDAAVLVTGVKPAEKATIELTDGTIRWTMAVEDTNQPKTLSYTGDLPSGGALQLVTTPASATWGVPGSRHGVYASIQPITAPERTDDFQTCIVSWGWSGEKPGRDAHGSMLATATSRSGQIDLLLPVVPCQDPAELQYHGAVDLEVTTCPVDMTCRSWEEAQATIGPLRWAR